MFCSSVSIIDFEQVNCLLGYISPFVKYCIPANIYLFKVNNRRRCEICSKLTVKTPERRQWHRSVFIVTLNIFHTFFSVFIVDFEQVSVSWHSIYVKLFRWLLDLIYSWYSVWVMLLFIVSKKNENDVKIVKFLFFLWCCLSRLEPKGEWISFFVQCESNKRISFLLAVGNSSVWRMTATFGLITMLKQ